MIFVSRLAAVTLAALMCWAAPASSQQPLPPPLPPPQQVQPMPQPAPQPPPQNASPAPMSIPAGGN